MPLYYPLVTTIGIVCNPKKPEAERLLAQLLDWLEHRDIEVRVDAGAASILAKKELSRSSEEVGAESDVVIAMGGDGTLLKAARLVGQTSTPILGINIGSLGFLTEIVEDEVYAILEDVVAGSYEIDKRMVLEATLGKGGQKFAALNDLVIIMGESGRIVEIALHVSDEYVCTFPADGVIVSTPTGSTAYSLAAGGPIVYPTMDCIIVTPICAHSLGVRPMILPSSERIRTQVLSRAEDARLVVDGQESLRLNSGIAVEIRKADYSTNLIKPKKKSFFKILRTKLRWGGREEDRAPRTQS
jgi:NAD+ kinase